MSEPLLSSETERSSVSPLLIERRPNTLHSKPFLEKHMALCCWLMCNSAPSGPLSPTPHSSLGGSTGDLGSSPRQLDKQQLPRVPDYRLAQPETHPPGQTCSLFSTTTPLVPRHFGQCSTQISGSYVFRAKQMIKQYQPKLFKLVGSHG